ncbi:2-hydroxyacid dehydrogenase [Roseomonas marmotae]|uniref:D-glycerate dehydrogenase n=1 Tax=Roseomonas marmotae TaxID=2768161 RepID=A0ABS3KI98_9PROT|nr:D-glycerate dehydrogenase [Roseomonas marmotae]MBO1076727.1 D-glycerate dehydrogenase [Roseomonas marmotae]QTI77972.1 D-glycerate dehydrogenase [Roseomonas marmotae]
MAAPRLLLARRVTPAAEDRARREFDALVADHDLDAEETIEAATRHRADALLIGSPCKLDAAAINRLPDYVKVIANASVGYDHMDADAAKARGIIVTNTPDVLTDCTADLAFMLLLAACRRAHEYDAMMRQGWGIRMGLADWLGVKPSGKTLGIVGMGRIGRAMAQRARGFGMRVLYHNRHRLPDDLEQGAEYFESLEAMLPHCQILSLHLPAGGATLMTRDAFALLPKGAVFVNTARGALVDEDALLEALKSGHLFAAGLDVFRKEPDFDRRFAELPNVFLTPHMASATQETRDAMGMLALDNIAAVCAGREALTPV